MTDFTIDELFAPAATSRPVFATAFASRGAASLLGVELLFDRFDDGRAVCAFARVRTAPGQPLGFSVAGGQRLEACPAGGWTIRPVTGPGPWYWLPRDPVGRSLDDQGHILRESAAAVTSLSTADDGISARCAAPLDLVDLVVWRFEDDAHQDALFRLGALETSRWFLWGSHSPYRVPADVYQHLNFGWVYESHYAWPHQRKICSENDAHALHVTLGGLQRATGKAFYGLLREQLLLSVLSRQSPDGAFRHGEWSPNMECHYRLHVSAMHLMMDALSDGRQDPAVAAALGRAADFVAAQTDTLEVGTWFLHDELEKDPASMAAGPFRWLATRTLGKSETNMLVLNTHFDTSVALDRFAALTGEHRHAATVASGRQATDAVLTLRPAEALYRVVFWFVGLTLLPTPQAMRLPLWQRALKRVGWKYVLPRLPDLKGRWPRLVMPGGYVDRELSLHLWAHAYLSINVMDLARYQRRMPSAVVERTMHEAAEFAHRSGILERWAELGYEKYALGFWAEALYHLCMAAPDRQVYREWMVQAVLLLEDTGQGLPPTLIGANSEALPPAEHLPCPVPVDARLRVVNLGRRGREEFLIVNPVGDPLSLAWAANAPDSQLTWNVPGSGAEATQVPPRGALWGRPA